MGVVSPLVLPVFAVFVLQCYGSIVDTEYGQVSGHLVNVDNGRDPVMPIEAFNAVPYAADMSGQNRFASPVAREPWEGIFDATPLGAICPQDADGVAFRLTHPGWSNVGEDCLHVNIYTKDVTGGPYPVMVWFHGGGYNSGANIQYPGHFLATKDVVVVTANYRLNTFGFAYSGNEACPGNAGLWDQNFALKWVINNIANFGGDPNLITVFGESAGAASTAAHVISPHSKDLFQRAIMQSGSETAPWAINLTPINNVEILAESMGCLGANDSDSIACLRKLTWQNIYENGTCAGSDCMPVVDGRGGFIPRNPSVLRDQGDIMTGPVMTGINHDEGSMFMPLFVPGTLIGCCNRSYYERVLRNRFVNFFLGGANNVTQEDVYQAMDFNYSPWPNIYDNYKNRESLEKIVTDVGFGYSWDNLLKDHYDVAPTWGYIYNYRGRNSTQMFPEWMGVPHAADIPYVWSYPLLAFNQDVVDDIQIEFDSIHFTEEDVSHTIYLNDLLTNFAKYGDPTPQPVDNPLGGTTVWPSFSWDEMNVLEISNTSIDIIQQYRQQDFAFWTRYMPYVAANDFLDPIIPEFVDDVMMGGGDDWNSMTWRLEDVFSDSWQDDD